MLNSRGIFLIFLLGFSAWLIYSGVNDYNHGVSSSHWPTVEGRVTDAHIEHHFKGGDTCEVKYQYVVNATTFSSSTIQFGGTPFGDAGALFARYKDPKVTIYYDPSDPRSCCLVQGWNGITALLYLIFLIGAVVQWRRMGDEEIDNKYLVAKSKYFGTRTSI